MELDRAGCPRCGTSRILPGQVVGHPTAPSSTWFRFELPSHPLIQLVWGTRRRIQLPDAASLCPQCGLVWIDVVPAVAAEVIRRRGSKQLSAEMGLAEKPIMADDELDGSY